MIQQFFYARHYTLWLLLSGGLSLAQPKASPSLAPASSAAGASAGSGTPATIKAVLPDSSKARTSKEAHRKASQEYDTVYVSGETTTYMIFPENVAVMDLGSRSYIGKIESGNMLYLKPLKANVAPSSLLVRTTGERIYLHYIAYKQRPEKMFWDYRADTLQAHMLSSGNNLEKAEDPAGPAIYTGQLDLLRKQPKRRVVRHQANGLKLTVSNLAVDRQAVYLLLDLANNSSIPYQLDYVSFIYKERRLRKSRRRIDPEENVVEPLAQVAARAVSPGSKECLAYALPLYAGTDRGTLEVVVRESNGNRMLSGRIPARRISRSLYLDSPKHTAVPQSRTNWHPQLNALTGSAPISRNHGR